MRLFGRGKPDPEPDPEPAPSFVPEVLHIPHGAFEIPAGVEFTSNGEPLRYITTADEAKELIAHLRQLKKGLQIEKKDVSIHMQEVRADYREANARRTHVRGRGSINSTIRTFQQINRDSARRGHANQLAPLDDAKAAIDRQIQVVDVTILELQRFQLTAPKATKPAKTAKSTATAPKFCVSCGSALKAGDRFCGDCGQPLRPVSADDV